MSMRPAPLVLVLLALLMQTAAADAQSARRRARVVGDAPYFMEFRARNGGVLGHTFVVYGRLQGGRALETGSAGLYPDDKYNDSILPVLIPVPSYVNVKKEDPDNDILAVYRRRLDAQQYAHLRLTIERLRVKHGRWHLFFYNCNDFAAQVAHEMGLWTPPSLMQPKAFVRSLRVLNGP